MKLMKIKHERILFPNLDKSAHTHRLDPSKTYMGLQETSRDPRDFLLNEDDNVIAIAIEIISTEIFPTLMIDY